MKYRMIVSLVAMLMTATSFAQSTERDYELYPYGFAGIQGGMHNTWSNPGTRDWKPVFGVQAGYFFTDVFGTRLQGTYSKWSVDLKDNTSYDASRLGIDMDLLFNFSNLFFPGRNNLINVIGVAGVPFEFAIPHTKLDIPATADNSKYTNWKRGWKGGGIIQLNVAKNWAIDLEAGTSYIAKRSADQTLKNRWWPYAMAGITYKFGHRSNYEKENKATTAPKTAPVVQDIVDNNKADVATAPIKVKETKTVEPKPVVAQKAEEKKTEAPKTNAQQEIKAPAKTTQNIFFDLGKADIKASEAKKISELADWAKKNANADIVMTGYADAETGNVSLNKTLSERRAAAVKKALAKKGINANRIKTDAKGDTVQPFSKNEDNRVVIVIGQCK